MVLASLLALALAGYASADPTVTLLGSYDDAHWYVYASDSVGDNSGLSALSFKVGGIDVTRASGAHGSYDVGDVSPHYPDWGGPGYWTPEGTFGFNQNTITVDATPHQVDYAISINPNFAAYILQGLGQGPVSVTFHVEGAPGSVTTTVPAQFLVATGTLLAGQTPFFATATAPTPFLGPGTSTYLPTQVALGGASVFAAPGTPVSVNAEVMVDTLTPEPATLSLVALGGLALLRRRKR
jgi:hypothetical protein